MLGFIIGGASGAAQFWMLSRFTQAITGGTFNTKAVLLGVAQFLIPLIVLLVCALLLRNDLLWAGVGMASALLGCALARFIKNRRKFR